jgi:hypothetical protein
MAALSSFVDQELPTCFALIRGNAGLFVRSPVDSSSVVDARSSSTAATAPDAGVGHQNDDVAPRDFARRLYAADNSEKFANFRGVAYDLHAVQR